MPRLVSLLVVCASVVAARAEEAAPPPPPAILVHVAPSPPLIERTDQQLVNLDFVVENRRAEPITLIAIEASVRDATGALELRRTIDGSGFRPAIETVPERTIAPSGRALFFNPLPSFAAGDELARIDFVLTFRGGDGDDAPSWRVPVSVAPQHYQQRVTLRLPLDGPVWVRHGHQLLDHHRRFDPLHPMAVRLGMRRNFMRYAFDLSPVGKDGAEHRGDGARNQDWIGFGAVVRAAGSGRVKAASDSLPDDVLGGQSFFDPSRIAADPMHFYGNFVVIDHGNGEATLYGHLERGSLRVAVGQHVEAGQPIGRVGNSGSAETPHLHFELRHGDGLDADGLPARFARYVRLVGARRVVERERAPSTGEIIAQP